LGPEAEQRTPLGRAAVGTFVDQARVEFVFLEARGFSVASDGPDFVRYKSIGGVFVHIFRDANEKHLGFKVGLSSRPRDALSAVELAQLSGQTRPRTLYPETQSELHSGMRSLAQLLREHGTRALGGDLGIYDEALELRERFTHGSTP
jgi:hypothetical protein